MEVTHYLNLMVDTEIQFKALFERLYNESHYEGVRDVRWECDREDSDHGNYNVAINIKVPDDSPVEQTLHEILTYILSIAKSFGLVTETRLIRDFRPRTQEVDDVRYELVQVIPEVKILADGYAKDYTAIH